MSGRSQSAPLTAGQRVRSELDEALLRAGRERNQTLEWSEQELICLGVVSATADRAEVLRAAFDVERSGQANPAVLVKLSGEIRSLDRQVVDLVARVNPDVGPAKSDRHARAANSRWGREAGA